MKKLFIFAALLLAVPFFSQPTLGLIEKWQFNNTYNSGSGVTTSNMSSVSIRPTFTVDRCGNSNSAVHFDGVDDFLEYTYPSNFGIPVNSAARSISFWMKTGNTTVGGGTSSVKAMFNYGKSVLVNGQVGGSFEIDHNYCTNGIGFDVSNEAITRQLVCLTNNIWHHVVAIWGGSGAYSSIVFYVDGNLVNATPCQITGGSQAVATLLGAISLGKSNDPVDRRHYQGDLDDYYFYNRAITAAEVMQLFNAQCGFTGPSTFCRNNAINAYSTTSYTGATYSWTVPSGWNIMSGSGTNSITAKSGTLASTGSISVSISTGCGTIIRSYPVSLKTSCGESTGISEITFQNNSLSQNVPNPFSELTVVSYNVPEIRKSAQLIVRNVQGAIIKTLDLERPGQGEVNINGYDLSPGLYFYVLIVDGAIIDSKKLVRE